MARRESRGLLFLHVVFIVCGSSLCSVRSCVLYDILRNLLSKWVIHPFLSSFFQPAARLLGMWFILWATLVLVSVRCFTFKSFFSLSLCHFDRTWCRWRKRPWYFWHQWRYAERLTKKRGHSPVMFSDCCKLKLKTSNLCANSGRAGSRGRRYCSWWGMTCMTSF